MRALWMLVLVAAVATACSSADDPLESASTSPGTSASPVLAIDENADVRTGARTLGEPTEADPDGEASDVLAFEEPLSETSDVDEVVQADPEQLRDAEDADVPVAEPTELSRLVDRLIGFVEDERGHSFTSRPTVTLLDGADFTDAWTGLIVADADEYAEEYADFTDIYRAVGVLDGTASLEDVWMRFGDAGVIGFYDTDTGDLVLRSGDITPFTETVLVHELVHALDDQIFDIDRPEYEERDDEIDWTFSALIEGSAGVIEERYRATLTQAQRDQEDTVRRNLPRSVSLSEFTTSFLELQFGRYDHGDVFAEALWDRGRDAVDAAFVEPPSTSETVIDPTAYFSGEDADDIDPPPADGDVFHSGVWGEAAWAALFADAFGPFDGLELADGWGGDRYVAWRSGTETCVRAHISGDSPEVLDDYALALEEWVLLAPGREVFYPTADIVRVTACG